MLYEEILSDYFQDARTRNGRKAMRLEIFPKTYRETLGLGESAAIRGGHQFAALEPLF